MSATLDLEARLITSEDRGAWVYAVMPEVAAVFGTRKAVKVVGTINGAAVSATLLPLGDGTHMLPVKAATRTAIGKDAGDRVQVQLRRAAPAR
ncbi:MAG: DUF1905 domain-containing protein [Dermatophilaceae bacterium]